MPAPVTCSKCLRHVSGSTNYPNFLGYCYCDYLNPPDAKAATITGGTKYDEGKPQLSLIPKFALDAEARVFGLGAKKYERFNFKKGFKYSRLIDAALRHIHAFNDGEDLDPETKESHLAHARCCLAMLLDTINLGTSEDDRYKKAP